MHTSSFRATLTLIFTKYFSLKDQVERMRIIFLCLEWGTHFFDFANLSVNTVGYYLSVKYDFITEFEIILFDIT